MEQFQNYSSQLHIGLFGMQFDFSSRNRRLCWERSNMLLDYVWCIFWFL